MRSHEVLGKRQLFPHVKDKSKTVLVFLAQLTKFQLNWIKSELLDTHRDLKQMKLNDLRGWGGDFLPAT